MKYRVRHTTTYEYSAPVTLCYNMAHLLPRDTERQRCLNRRIQVHPNPIYQREGTDYFGNPTFYFSIQEPHKKLTIDVVSYFDIQLPEWLNQTEQHPLTCGDLRSMLHSAATTPLRMAKEYCLDSEQILTSNVLRDYAQPFFKDDQPLLQATKAFTQHILSLCRYCVFLCAVSVFFPAERDFCYLIVFVEEDSFSYLSFLCIFICIFVFSVSFGSNVCVFCCCCVII